MHDHPDQSLPAPSRALALLARPPVALAAVLGTAALTGLAGSLLQSRVAAAVAPPPPAAASMPLSLGSFKPEELLPDNIRPLAAQDAAAINARNPLAGGTNPAAAPFRAGFASASDRTRSLECMTSAIYYEAANESDAGQRAVAQVVLNRVGHIAYPNSVCGVVYQGSERSTGCQFSFTCDGSLARKPSAAGWARARRNAEAALGGAVSAEVGRSTHYHANYVVPYWSSSLLKTAVIGAHIFYRSPGSAGLPAAFAARYAGVEPAIGAPLPETETAVAALEDPAEYSGLASLKALTPSKLPEHRAEELDRFALLDYKTPPQTGKEGTKRTMPLDETLGAALADTPAPRPQQAAPPRIVIGVSR